MFDVSLRSLWLVLRREYRVRVRSRSFVVWTIATPLMFVVFGFLSAIVGVLVGRPPGQQHGRERVVIVCSDRKLADFVAAQLGEDPAENHQVDIDRDSSARERERLNRQLRTSALVAYVWLDNDAIATGQAIYYARGSGDHYLYSYLRHNIALALARARLSERGLAGGEINQALSPVDLRFHSAGPEPAQTGSLVARAGVYVLAYVLLFALMSYGTMVMQSVMEEKLSRITELLLVSTRPEELMGGKILGVGCVGLTQMGIWFVLGGALIMVLPGARGAVYSLHIGIDLVAYFVVFFLLGYLLYSALFAVAGVSSEGTRASSQWMVLVMLPLVVSFMLLPVSDKPDSTAAVLTSMVPYFAPVLMCARIAVGSPPGWQIGLCIALMVATICVSSIICARIYRVGVLMYGKRLSVKEVARWLRYA